MEFFNETELHGADYLQVLDLTCPPFAHETSSEIFYTEPERVNCLDLLLHLGRFGEQVLLVLGPLGSGKTTLLNQFWKKSDRSVFTCRIDVDSALDKLQMEDLLISELGVANGVDRQQGIKRILKKRLEVISRKFSAIILLVDNVDKLSAELHSLLLDIGSIVNDDGSPLLHLILFSELQTEPVLCELFADNLKILKLTPFTLEETSKYLRYRMELAGSAEEQFSNIFDSVSILNIYRLSDGLPARINRLAHNKLIEVADKKSPPLVMRKLNRSSKLQLLTSALLVGVITLGWLYPDNIRQHVIKLQQEYNTAMTTLENTYFPGDESVDESNLSTIVEDSEILSMNTDSATEIVTQKLIDTDQFELEIAKLEMAGLKKAVPVKEETTEGLLEEVPSHDIRREKWLLSQEGQKYTLQLFGSSDEAEINLIVKRYKLDGLLAYYRTQRKGGQWYGLTYGVYADLREAQGAAKELPVRLKNDVWVRKLRSIHRDIQKSTQ